MLFDLQSTRRRRTTVKIVYAFLALLMAGGLVFLGVGTGNGNGGIANIADNNGSASGGNSSANSLVNTELASAAKQIKAAPDAPASWAAELNARYDDAVSGNNLDSTTLVFSAAGKAQMALALAAWEKYDKLKSGALSEEATAEGARAALAVGNFTQATVAWQGFIAAVPSSSTGYTCLALNAYAAKNTTLGSEAAAKAVALTPKLDQLQAKQALAAAKTPATAKQDAESDTQCYPQ
jgi:hypothetical protein